MRDRTQLVAALGLALILMVAALHVHARSQTGYDEAINTILCDCGCHPQTVKECACGRAAEMRGGDYFGSTLNRCARIEELAHGAQTLLSHATCQLVRDDLPADVGLRDLGEHRLRDLSRPERIHQLVHPALPDEFPPLMSLDRMPHNLPIRRSRFIGREKLDFQFVMTFAAYNLIRMRNLGVVSC